MNRLKRRRRLRAGMASDRTGFVPREMCFRCARPLSTCHCHTIPKVDNQTELLLAQHIRERSHPFNTARMVKSSLSNVVAIIDYAESMPSYDHLLKPGAALLYPSKSSRLLEELSPDSRPDQVIVLDGTWHQAKRLFKNWPALQQLPHYRLAMQQPGQYKIRLEPDKFSLSTVEAVVAAYGILEPKLTGLDQLLKSFETMIANQLAHPSARYQQSLVPREPNINVPRALISDDNQLIVAYGEAAPGKDGRWNRHTVRPPVYWVAKRLATGERFSMTITPPFDIAQRYIKHFDLEPDHFDNANTINCFREKWSRFAHKEDVLVVYNGSTLRLLSAINISPGKSIELKSVNFDPNNKYSSLSDMFDAEGVNRLPVQFAGRAGVRLRNVEMLVELLRSKLSSG